MRSYLGDIGVEFERFEAIRPTIESLTSLDGNYHEFYSRATPRFQFYANNKTFYPRAVGVFGVYISHYLIHKKAFSEGHGDYVILEDDCRISVGVLERVAHAVSKGLIGEDWDIIRDCWHSTAEVRKFTSSHQESHHARRGSAHNIFGGAHFSIFKSRSCGKLLEYLCNDRLLAIDAAYSTHMMNVYHGKFGATLENLGTDIPKIDDSKTTISTDFAP